MFYPGKFDLFEHGILFFVFHIIDGFHSDVIKLLSQNSEVLRILI